MSKIQRRRVRRPAGVRRSIPNQIESLETRLLLAADWQNPMDPLDVDAAETAVAVTPLDALLVINEINNPQISDRATGQLPQMPDDAIMSAPFVDVNADGYVTPLDALLVINELNVEPFGDAGEFTSVFAPASVIVGSRAALEDGIDVDTLVNMTTSRRQQSADVAADSSGNMVMVWESFDQDGSSWGVFGQRYNPDGEKVGDEFRVNTVTNRGQRTPMVSMSPNGGFMVVWQSLRQDGSCWGVYGQEYDAEGNAVGAETRINETTRGGQLNPDIVGTDNGYVVVWEGRGVGDHNGIFARRVGSTIEDGQEDVILVNNTMTRGNQARPSVDVNATGEVFIAWNGRGNGDSNGVFMKPFGSTDPAILVNVNRSGAQAKPAISVGGDDQIVVAWQSDNEVIMRPFTMAGEPISGEILVNQTIRGAQRGPSVDHLADGSIAVAWFGRGVGDRRGAFTRVFDASGTATTDETLQNHTTRAGQVVPAISAVNDGFVTVWQGVGPGDHRGVFARFNETGAVGPFRIEPIADQVVNEGQTVSVDVNIVDLDGVADTVTFAIESGPDGAMIDATTGQFTWVTDEADGPSVQTVEISATGLDLNEQTFTSSTTFTITVNEVNTAPVLAPIGNQSTLVGTPFSLVVTATDADLPAQTLTFAASGLPSWLSFNPSNQTFSGNPQSGDVGSSNVTVQVTDSLGGTDSETFAIAVTQTNLPPVGDVPNQSATEGVAFSLNVSGFFSDPNGDTLTFTTGNLPAWLGFSGSTFSGTPAAGDVGSSTISVTATDPDSASVTDTFVLTVSAAGNNSPVISDQTFSIPLGLAEGTTVGTMVAADPDPGTMLQYRFVDDIPTTAFGINQSTGVITVTNAGALAEGTFVFTVEASDGTLTDTSSATIFVTADTAIAAYALTAENSSGEVVTSLAPGEEFELVLMVQDIRTDGNGIFSAYTDIVFPTSLVTIIGDIQFTTIYGAATSGGLDTPGLINEAGAVDGITALGTDALEVLRVPMRVASGLPDGTPLFFGTNETEDQVLHPTLVFQGTTPVPATEIDFGFLVVSVDSAAEAFGTAPSSFGAVSMPPLSQSASIPAVHVPLTVVGQVAVPYAPLAVALNNPTTTTSAAHSSAIDEVFRQVEDEDESFSWPEGI